MFERTFVVPALYIASAVTSFPATFIQKRRCDIPYFALTAGLKTIVCVGETLTQREQGITSEIVSLQTKIALLGVDAQSLSNVIIAYEPVWAIGVNGVPASADYADEKHGVIKSVLRDLYGSDADRIPVLYGGSVNRQNCEELAEQKNIDGLFIGRAAWNAQPFNEIIRTVLPIFKTKNK